MKKIIMTAIVMTLAFLMVFSFSLFGCKPTTQETADETPAAADETPAATDEEVVIPTTPEGFRDIAGYLKTLDNSAFEVVQDNKATGHRWFDDMAMGIEWFGDDFGLKASNQAPDAGDAALQNKILEDLIARLEPGKSAVICVPNDAASMDPVAGKANDAGIVTIGYEGLTMKNITYDMEAYDNEAFGAMMMENLAKSMNYEGEYAVSVGLLTMEVHMTWGNAGVAYQKANYPNMTLVTETFVESGNDAKQAYTIVEEALKGYPNLKGWLACDGAVVPSAARIVEEKNLIDKFFLSGLALPSTVHDYIESGVVSSVSCSNPIWQSYALGVVALAVLHGIELMPGDYLGQPGYDIVTMTPGAGDNQIIWPHGEVTVTKENVNDEGMDF